MSTLAATPETLDIGRVIQQLFAVLSRNLVTFTVLALILTGIPSIAVSLLAPQATGSNMSATGLAWLASTGLISMVAGLVLQGALIYGTINDLNSRPFSITDGLAVGLRNFPGLLAVGIIYGLAVFFGCLLLVVPGVMVAVAWIAAVPVLIAERLGVFSTFGRSAELTRGNRWRIFGLMLLYIAVYLLIGAVIAVAGGVASFTAQAVPGAVTVQHVIIEVITNVLSALVGATGGAVLYVELRRVREGVGHEALAAIFD
jgi:hypothetical protein